MYLYCICPYGNLKSNFIKIGICTKPDSLKKRYTTYYGSSYKNYYIKVENSNFENIIHRKLKNKGLHIENELFIYNEKYNFTFYIQQLNEINKEDEDEYSEIEDVVRRVNILDIKKDTKIKIVNKENTKIYDDNIEIENNFINNYKEFIKKNVVKIPKTINKIEDILLDFKEIKEDCCLYINIPGLYEITNKLNIFKNILENIYLFYS